MKITHVVRQYLPQAGGLEFAVHDLATAQVRAGHCVRVVTLNRSFADVSRVLQRTETIDGVEVVRVPFYGSRRYPLAPAMAMHLNGADILHVHAIDFAFDYFGLLGFFKRLPLVVTTHGGFFHTDRFGFLKKIYFRTVSRATICSYAAVICVSEQDRETFRAIRPEGIVTIPNGVNIDKFVDASAASKTKYAIAISRFSHNKRIDRVIETFREMLAIDPDWRLAIVGRNDDLDGRYVQSLVDAAGIADRVVLAVGYSNEQIRPLMAHCSVFLSASEYEGFGIAAVEAMAAGLYPFLNDIPPYRALVAKTNYGSLVDFSTPAEAARRILSIWDSIDDFSTTRTGLEASARLFEMSSAVREVETVYRQVLGIETRSVLGVKIAAFSSDQAVDYIDRSHGRGKTLRVYFANANFLNLIRRRPDREVLLANSLVLNDGLGVDIASKVLFGSTFPDNLNGTDFCPAYLANTRRALKIFLLGGEAGVAEAAAVTLKERYPQHDIVGVRDGYFGAAKDAEVVAQIRESGADTLFCGMGNLKQEDWLALHADATGCSVAFAVGAFLDFVSETKPRAPEWFRRNRLEWLFRMLLEPKRLHRRYLVDGVLFLARVFGQYMGGQRI